MSRRKSLNDLAKKNRFLFFKKWVFQTEKLQKKIKKSLNVFCTSFVLCNNFVKLDDMPQKNLWAVQQTLVTEIKVKFFKGVEKIMHLK